ncbi:MAG: ORF6N domain-containing protein, partial [Tannerella sp.]|nr:ORF6N domain-containing protein [Tannerella sp.]
MVLQSIQNIIYEIRGQKVMLDHDSEMMYQVPRSQIMTSNEKGEILMSQIVTSSWGGTSSRPRSGQTYITGGKPARRAVRNPRWRNAPATRRPVGAQQMAYPDAGCT